MHPLRAAAAWLALLSLQACRIANPNHCLHKDASGDGNAWCRMAEPQLPYCSPCAAENHGCVASEPTPQSCPDYSQGGETSETSGTSETSETSGFASETSGATETGA
jgi:hypothetical protein